VQIGIPNVESKTYSKILKVTPVGRVSPPDSCPTSIKFGIPTSKYINMIEVSYNEVDQTVNEVKIHTTQSANPVIGGKPKAGDKTVKYEFDADK